MRKIHFNKNKKIYKSRLTINHYLIILMAILISIQVFTSNKLATSGQLLSELEQKSVILEEENRKLLSSNMDNLSLHELALQAKKLGFVEPEIVINLNEKQGDGLAMR